MPTAVLLSGGLDSAVLVADEATSGDVHPVYVAAGLAWEAAERATVSSFLARAPLDGRALEGRPPAYHTPDDDVYLPGRNVILLSKAAVYCAAAKVERLVIGTLAHNPFPDATP